jgi:acyltransferase
MKTNRLLALDVVRVMAIVAISVKHMWGGPPGSDSIFRELISPWSVPVFFFLTGYLWTSGRTLRREIRTRARTLLVPYLGWLVVIAVTVTVLHVHSAFPGELLKSALWGGAHANGPFAVFWFLPTLFLVALLLRSLERVPPPVAWIVATAGLVTAWLDPGLFADVPLDAALAFPCLIYCLAGRALRQLTLPDSSALRAMVAAAIGLAGISSYVGHLIRPPDIKYGNFGTPVTGVLLSIAICAALVVFAQAVFPDTTQGPVVNEMATASTVVQLTHLGLFQGLVALGLIAPITFCLGLTLSWSTGIVLHRTPLSRYLLGAARLERHAVEPGPRPPGWRTPGSR